jgi:hypothetical protein
VLWKRKPPEPMNAGDAWLLGALSPYLNVLELPSEALIEPSSRAIHQDLLERLQRDSRDGVLADTVQRLYRGQRVEVARLQRAEPQRAQTDGLVFDLVMGLLTCRAALNTGILEGAEARAIMFALGRRLQSLFGSWRDFLIAFAQVYALQRELAGQEAAETALDMQSFHATATRLLEPGCLWQMIPWKLALPDGEAELELATRTYLTAAIFYRHENGFGPSSLNWCLSVAAIYRTWWGEPIDSLEPAEMMMVILERDWTISKREDLLDTLEDLLIDGHCSILREMQADDPSLPQDDPLVWDLVRFMQLATSGVCVGFIDHEECLHLMLHAAKRLQQAYSGWSEMLAAFKVGRDLWMQMVGMDLEEVAADNESLDDVLEILASDERSPCLKVPWSYLFESIPNRARFAQFPDAMHNKDFKHQP